MMKKVFSLAILFMPLFSCSTSNELTFSNEKRKLNRFITKNVDNKLLPLKKRRIPVQTNNISRKTIPMGKESLKRLKKEHEITSATIFKNRISSTAKYDEQEKRFLTTCHLCKKKFSCKEQHSLPRLHILHNARKHNLLITEKKITINDQETRTALKKSGSSGITTVKNPSTPTIRASRGQQSELEGSGRTVGVYFLRLNSTVTFCCKDIITSKNNHLKASRQVHLILHHAILLYKKNAIDLEILN